MKKLILILMTSFCFWALAQDGPAEPVAPSNNIDEASVDKRQYFSVVTKIVNKKNPMCEILILKHFDETGIWIIQVDKRNSTRKSKVTMDDIVRNKLQYYGKVGVYYSLNKKLDEGEVFRSLASTHKEGIPSLDIKYEFKGKFDVKSLSLSKLRYFSDDYSDKPCLD